MINIIFSDVNSIILLKIWLICLISRRFQKTLCILTFSDSILMITDSIAAKNTKYSSISSDFIHNRHKAVRFWKDLAPWLDRSQLMRKVLFLALLPRIIEEGFPPMRVNACYETRFTLKEEGKAPLLLQKAPIAQWEPSRVNYTPFDFSTLFLSSSYQQTRTESIQSCRECFLPMLWKPTGTHWNGKRKANAI